jgi:glycerol-3-phosphate dehydrogenase (NAD+)
MWVYEELIDGQKLTDLINNDHTNPKYLPGVALPHNVKACPDLVESCADADILLFITPHQYLKKTLDTMKGHVKSTAVVASLIKGLDVSPTGPKLLSEMIRSTLGLQKEVAVLMGANLASDVASDAPVESTIACKDPAVASSVAKLFQCDAFRVDTSCRDVATVEICGALKNVVAMGAGMFRNVIIVYLRHELLGRRL